MTPRVEQLSSSLASRWLDKTPPFGMAGPQLADERRFCPVSFRYADGPVVELSPTATDVEFHGDRGTMHLRRNAFRVDPPELVVDGPLPELKEKWQGDGHVARPHIENWLACVRSRETPHAPVEVGHRTATICHLINLSRQLGRTLRWDPARELCVGDEEANSMLVRPRRDGFLLPT